MKKVGFLIIILAAAFMTFTAQNCSKRDPYVIPGSVANPKAVGSPLGAIGITVKTSNLSNFDPKAIVTMAWGEDSLKNNKGVIIQTADDSGYTQFNNLIVGKGYAFHAKWTDGSGATYKSSDTIFYASDAKFPGNNALPVR